MEKSKKANKRKNKNVDLDMDIDSEQNSNEEETKEIKNSNKKKNKSKSVTNSKTRSVSKSSTNSKKTKEDKEKTLDNEIKDESNSNLPKKKTQKTLGDFGLGKSKQSAEISVIPNDVQLRIYSWNVAGLRAVLKKPGWKEFIDAENPDILCLNETKVDESTIEKNNFENLLGSNYKAYFNCSQSKQGYSGTAIFTKFKPLAVTYGIGKQEHDDEGRVITMEFDKFFLVATYIPNAGEGLRRLGYRVKQWDVDFQAYLEDLKKKKSVIWGGDINVAHQDIDIHDPKGNKFSAGFTTEERNSFSEFLKNGWVDTFRDMNKDVVLYSYWTYFFNCRAKNKGWRLDYFIVDENSKKNVVNSEILTNYLGSDHCPIKLTWKN